MDKEQCLKLIRLYGEYRRLWDAQCPDYTNRGLREDAWRKISQEMNLPIAELKKKMDSLLGSYRREKSREKKSRITGSGIYYLMFMIRVNNIHFIIYKVTSVFI